MNIRDEIKRHYLRHFGAPSREAEFAAANDGRVIEIWKWDEKASGQGVALYSTIGASDYQSGSTRCEYFIGLLPEEDSVASSLAEVALHGSGRGANPVFGDTVTLAQPLWATAGMHSFLFTSGGEEIVPEILNVELNIRFMQLVPLFENEIKFKIEQGERFLWDKFRENHVEYWNPMRSSVFS